jgi:hypothetical protein
LRNGVLTDEGRGAGEEGVEGGEVKLIDDMKTLSELMKPLVDDPRVGPLHLAMYLAIWQCWEKAGQVEAFVVHRRELMRMAKVYGNTTYYRLMAELNNIGVIAYMPRRWKKDGTTIFIVHL